MLINILANAVNCEFGGNTVQIDGSLVGVIRSIYDIIRFGVPLLLVIFGMLDLGKAVISQKEDEIKKNQSLFVKRLIAAALVFFVFAIVKLVVSIVGGDMNCANSILNLH